VAEEIYTGSRDKREGEVAAVEIGANCYVAS